MAQPCRRLVPLRPSQITAPSTSSPTSRCAACTFSTTTSRTYPRDRNPDRGVSALRRTGLRQPVSVSKFPLPKPVLDPKKREQFKTDKDHGLWGFFDEKRNRVSSPAVDMAFGRPWTVAELRTKSWEDLHSLWWTCVKERNRISTSMREHSRMKLGFGKYNYEKRIEAVKRTQKHIKWALTERWHAWEDARRLAARDESVDLTAEEGGAYDPELDLSGPFMEEHTESSDGKGDRRI